MFKLLVFTTLFWYVLGITPTQNTINRARTRILSEIEADTDVTTAGIEYPLVAGFVRLAFHDCVGEGSCDGCIDHSLNDNAGLSRYTDVLDRVYDRRFSGDISRADFYALAAVVALEKATEMSPDKFTGAAQMQYGREDCSTSPVEDSANTFPSSFGNLETTLAYFATHFGLSTQQTVAFLGAHTLGRGHIENSGYEGRWVRASNAAQGVNSPNPASVLDNAYYREILRPWVQVDVTYNNVTKAQWQNPGTEVNDLESRDNPDQPPMLFNSDICFRFSFTVIDKEGHVDCAPCPPSATVAQVILYSNNNAQWLSDFTDVFMLMISRNNVDLTTVTADAPTATEDETFRAEIREILDEIIVN